MMNQRDAVFSSLLSAIRERVSYAGLLTIQGDRAVGRGDIAEVSIPLEPDTAFGKVAKSASPYVGPIATGEAVVDEMIERMGGVVPPTAVLLPIVVRDRTVAIAIGHRGTHPLGDVSDLLSLASETSEAISRIILANKRASTVKGPGALQWMEDEYTYEQRWPELVKLLEQRITGANSDLEKVEIYKRLATVWQDKLAQPRNALEAWENADRLAPFDPETLSALAELYRMNQSWVELCEILERIAALPSADDGDKLALYAEIAELDGGIDEWKRVLAIDPEHLKALRALEQLFMRDSRWAECVEVIETLARVARGGERVDACLQAAALWENKLDEPERAINAYELARQVEPANEVATEQLTESYRDSEQWEPLAEVLLERAAACDDSRERVELLAEVADVYESKLADGESALAVWEQLVRTRAEVAEDFELADTDSKVEYWQLQADVFENKLGDDLRAIEAHRAALTADPDCMVALVSLERLYRRNERWEQLVFVLRRTAELRSEDLEPAELVRVQLEIGRMCEDHLSDSDGAARAYRAVLSADPANLPALESLAQLYESTDQPEKYLDALEAQLDATESLDPAQRNLYRRIASAWEGDYGRTDRAVACLEKTVVRAAHDDETFRALVDLHRKSKQWESLVNTYGAYIAETEEVTARVDLYVEMAEVCEKHLRDDLRAIEVYRQVLELDPEEPRTLDALGRLYEQTEQWDCAFAVLSELLSESQCPHDQLDLNYRLGRLLVARNDAELAEAHLTRALAINADHLPTLSLLAQVFNEQQQWTRAVDVLLLAEPLHDNPMDRAQLLYDAGRICLDELEDGDRAQQCFRAVLALDPEHVAAARPLAELDFASERWQELSPVVDMLLRKADADAELLCVAAACADALGNTDRAEQLLRRGLEAEDAHPGAQRQLADLLYRTNRLRDAAGVYESVLARGRDAELCHRLGEIYRGLGTLDKALALFDEAFAASPADTELLDSIIEIHTKRGDFEAVVQARQAMLDTLDTVERAAMLDAIGDVFAVRLDDRDGAIAAYREATELDPAAHSVRQKLLELYTSAELWTEAIGTIEQFIELEDSPVRRGAYHHAAAAIYRERLDDNDRAVDHYERALDALFSQSELSDATRKRALEAFRCIDEIYTETRAWKQQEQVYRRMIKRVTAGDPLLPKLWHSLGEIYRSRLVHHQSAIEAFEIAKQLDPTNAKRNAILAELYLLAGEDHADRAVAQHAHMLRLDPTNVDSYRALFRIYKDANQYDKAWCVCEALVHLGKAGPNERKLRDTYKSRACAKAVRPLGPDGWRRLRAPGADPSISTVFEAIWRDAAVSRAQPHKSFGLKRKDRCSLDSSETAVQAVRYLAPLVGIPDPDVFLRPEEPGDVAFANCIAGDRLKPSLVLRAGVLRGQPAPTVMYRLAHMLTLMRPEHYLELALPTCAEREFVLRSAVSGEDADRCDVTAWGQGVRATASRVGLLLSGDLSTAVELAAAESCVVGGPRSADKANDLLLFAVSEDYFALRERLGLTIGA